MFEYGQILEYRLLNLLHLIQYKTVSAKRKAHTLDAICSSPKNDHTGVFENHIIQQLGRLSARMRRMWGRTHKNREIESCSQFWKEQRTTCHQQAVLPGVLVRQRDYRGKTCQT